MSLIHLARQGFITKSALPSVTRTRGASYQPSLLLLGEGTNGSTSITDSSQNALAVTVGGNAQISTAQKPTGMTSSIAFDGNGDYLSVGANSLLQLGSGNFTIEFWIYYNGFTSYQTILANGYDGVVTGAWTIQTSNTNVGTLNFYFQGSNVVVAETGSISTGSWSHVAFVKSGSTITIYRNGKSVGSATDTNNYSSNNYLAIGGGSSTGFNNFWLNGYISNLRIVKGTALYTKNFFVPTLPLSTFAQQKAYPDLLLLGSGTNGSTTITDSSPNAFTITRNGDTNISTAQYPVGMTSSIYFDGTGDYVTAADNANLRPGAGAFTLEAWIYRSASGTAHTIYAKGGASTGIEFQITSTNVLRFTATTTNIDSTGTVAATTWTHVAVVREGTGTNQTKLYINGTQDGQGTVATDFTQTEEARVGTDRSAANNFNGYISSVRFTKGTALYTGKFNVSLLPLPSSSTSPGASPSLYITGDGINNSTNIIDSSPNAFTITRNGDTKISTAQAPTAMASSVYFDGTGDYLSVANNAAFDFGTGDFTIEAYVYIAGNSSLDGSNRRYANIFSLTTASAWPFGFAIQGNSTTTGTGLEIVNGTTAALVSTTIQQSTWNHIAVVRSGSSAYFFVNGTQVGTTQSISGSWGSSTVAGQIGQTIYTSYNYPLNGYISNLRITKGAALYTATFVPPPLPLLSNFNYISYPSLLLRGAGANNSTTFTDSSPNAFTVTAFGDAKISTAQAPTGMSSSMYFDGTGDYLSVADNAAFNFASSDFTVEVWFYASASVVTHQTIVAKVGGAYWPTNYQWRFAILNSTLYFSSYTTTAVDLSSGATLATNTWYHIAISRVGNTFSLFLNGSLVASATNSAAITSGTSPVYVGRDDEYGATGRYFTGYISNLRIIKGTGIYRSNFTPPVLPASATPETNLTPSTTASTVTNNVYGVYQLA